MAIKKGTFTNKVHTELTPAFEKFVELATNDGYDITLVKQTDENMNIIIDNCCNVTFCKQTTDVKGSWEFIQRYVELRKLLERMEK